MAFLSRKAQIFTVLLSCFGLCHLYNPQVCIKTGCLEGTTIKTYFEDRTVCAYRGIPYAEPPERFKDSVPKKPWRGVLDATRDGQPCVQRESEVPGAPVNIIGSEDCLNCAVYTPHTHAQGGEYGGADDLLPVMVFLYPGVWEQGTNKESNWGPEFMLNKPLVLVVCNPRLDVFGYLNTGDSVAPGNFGFRDQVLSLKWVQSNIQYFGGNPNNVTLFGEASGGSACDLHLQSPLSQGLFKQVIAESGTALYPVALKEPEAVVKSTQQLAKLVGCQPCPSEVLVECMRSVPAAKLILAQADLATNGFPPYSQRPWAPTLDFTYQNQTKATFPADPRIADHSQPLSLITGFVVNDGTVITASIIYNETFQNLVFENPKFYLPQVLNLEYLFPKNTVPTVMDKVYSFYFQDQPLSRDLTRNIIDMFTDYDFFTATIVSALRHRKLGAHVWYFAYDYVTPASFNDILLPPGTLPEKPGHGDNTNTLFPQPIYFKNRTYSKADVEFISDRWDLWYNFASTGNPTSGNHKIQWNMIGSLDNYNLLVLDLNFRQVCIKSGCLEGTTIKTYFEDRTVCAYRGIPYAEPPERFKDSVPKRPWKGVLDATRDGQPCVQRESEVPGAPLKIIGSEDCLNCAVYTPHTYGEGGEYDGASALLPVMAFLYPGVWEQGSNLESNWGPEFMLNKPLVMVFCNPRLDVFGEFSFEFSPKPDCWNQGIGTQGYLNTGDSVAPGNFGFRDQVLSLKWVQSNIQYFGGNPNNVTLFGEATGGSACDLHLQSPLSQCLFKQAIVESGTALYPVALKEAEAVVKSTQQLAKLVGCQPCPSEVLVECMRSVPATKLILAQADLATDGFPPYSQRPWAPTLDFTYQNQTKATFPADPRIADHSQPLSLITGFVVNEGTIFTASVIYNETFQSLVFENPKFYLPQLLNLAYLFPKNTVPTVMDQVYSFSFQDQPLSRNLTRNIIDVSSTHYDFFTATIVSALRHRKLGAHVWYLAYDYVTPASFNDILLPPGTLPEKPGHGDNTNTLFPQPGFFKYRTYSDADVEFISDRWDLWYNFASTGNPTSGNQNIRWNTIGSLDNYNLLVLDLNFRQVVRFRAPRLLFWINLLRKYAPNLDLNL